MTAIATSSLGTKSSTTQKNPKINPNPYIHVSDSMVLNPTREQGSVGEKEVEREAIIFGEFSVPVAFESKKNKFSFF